MGTEEEGIQQPEEKLNVMAIDLCEHITAMIRNAPCTRVTSVETRGNGTLLDRDDEIDFIVIGAPKFPVRRPFISRLREAYADVPILILRRVELKYGDGEIIRGEFVLSDQPHKNDLELVKAVRQLFPIRPCQHTDKELNFDTVRNVMKIIADNYADPELDLEKVANSLPLSPVQLSHILYQEVGVSFRHLLRHTRIEEAKRLLASHRYSVKEVAVRVGFGDSHYFSRTFKELTGQSATEYRSRSTTLSE
jgi:AraC-like DNA-binding protein